MIDVLVVGEYLDKPHEVGAWAYLCRRGGEPVGEGKGNGRPAAVASRLAAEVAAVAAAFEDLALTWYGEDVLVWTTSSLLEALLTRRGRGAHGDVARWFLRLARAARQFAGVAVRIAPRESMDQLHAVVRHLLPHVGISTSATEEFHDGARRP